MQHARRDNGLQAARNGGQIEHAAVRRPAAFENVQLQRPGRAGAHQKAQRRGRCLVLAGFGPKEKHQPLKLLRTDLQAADLVRVRLRQPGQQHAAGVGADELLQRPQPVLLAGAGHPHQLLRRQPALRQAAGVRRQWRAHGDHGLALLAVLLQGGGGQAPFQQAGLGLQHLGQALARPALAGQLGVQRIPAGGRAGQLGAHHAVATPQAGGYRGRQGDGWGMWAAGHDEYWFYIQYKAQHCPCL